MEYLSIVDISIFLVSFLYVFVFVLVFTCGAFTVANMFGECFVQFLCLEWLCLRNWSGKLNMCFACSR